MKFRDYFKSVMNEAESEAGGEYAYSDYPMVVFTDKNAAKSAIDRAIHETTNAGYWMKGALHKGASPSEVFDMNGSFGHKKDERVSKEMEQQIEEEGKIKAFIYEAKESWDFPTEEEAKPVYDAIEKIIRNLPKGVYALPSTMDSETNKQKIEKKGAGILLLSVFYDPDFKPVKEPIEEPVKPPLANTPVGKEQPTEKENP